MGNQHWSTVIYESVLTLNHHAILRIGIQCFSQAKLLIFSFVNINKMNYSVIYLYTYYLRVNIICANHIKPEVIRSQTRVKLSILIFRSPYTRSFEFDAHRTRPAMGRNMLLASKPTLTDGQQLKGLPTMYQTSLEIFCKGCNDIWNDTK